MLLKKLKKILNSVILFMSWELDKFPKIKQKVFDIRYLIWRLTIKIRHRGIVKAPGPEKIYLMDPNKIVFLHNKVFHGINDRGRVVGGDWDLTKNRTQFEHLDVYQSFRQRFIEHKNWEETGFYQRILTEILDGRTKWDCTSREQIDERLKGIEQLFCDIEENGFKTQKELNAGSQTMFGEDEIAVSIARTGEILFTDGRHRLCIAKILGFKEVPVKITVRHPQWVKFRNEILSYIEDKLGGKGYQPVTHPDLYDVPYLFGNDRFQAIKDNLLTKTGTLLDIGSFWGYFCHKFEDEGFDCYAVEHNPINYYFLNRLRQAENRRFKVFLGSIFDYRDKLDFDVVLGLNIFHHFLRYKESYLKLLKLLEKLEMKELFMQTARCDEPMMKDAYKNPTVEELIAVVLKHSCLKKARPIGESTDGRILVQLTQ